MTLKDPRTGRFTAQRTTTTPVTERVTIEPAPGPLLPAARARLAAPLPYPAPPVIFTPAMRAEAAEWQDELRGQAAGDEATVGAWLAEAREAVFGPLDAWLAAAPEMLP